MTQADAASGPPPSAEAAKPRPRAPRILAGLLGAAALIGGGYQLWHHNRESTDDAQVEGRVVNISARVASPVLRVHVKDNQEVKAGDPLVDLDPREFEARVQLARADLASAQAQRAASEAQLALTEANIDANLTQARGGLRQAESGVVSSEASVAQARADVEAARARERLARIELDRTSRLQRSGAASNAELDAKQSAYDTAKATLDQAEARLRTATANTIGSQGNVAVARGRYVAADTGAQQVQTARAQVDLAKARVQQAEANLRLAELNLGYTKITAPISGQVSRKSVEVGQQVAPDRALLALVPLEDVWVVANFKEDQLPKMRPGQRAVVRVDSYGSREFDGTIDSLSAATGARFSLLPPDNASGNFVKVTQRVPVRIALGAAPGVVLRPGLSAYVTVFTQ